MNFLILDFKSWILEFLLSSCGHELGNLASHRVIFDAIWDVYLRKERLIALHESGM